MTDHFVAMQPLPLGKYLYADSISLSLNSEEGLWAPGLIRVLSHILIRQSTGVHINPSRCGF